MHEGLLSLCKLVNQAAPGEMPHEILEVVDKAFYREEMVGVTRAFAAMSAQQRVDMLVRCFFTICPKNVSFVMLEDGEAYEILLKQQKGDDVLLTLKRMEGYDDNSNKA